MLSGTRGIWLHSGFERDLAGPPSLRPQRGLCSLIYLSLVGSGSIWYIDDVDSPHRLSHDQR